MWTITRYLNVEFFNSDFFHILKKYPFPMTMKHSFYILDYIQKIFSLYKLPVHIKIAPHFSWIHNIVGSILCEKILFLQHMEVMKTETTSISASTITIFNLFKSLGKSIRFTIFIEKGMKYSVKRILICFILIFIVFL